MEYLRNSYTLNAKYEEEKRRENERKKEFKLVKKYKKFDLYVHKKYGFRECFPKENVSNSK